jgi:hypothetical protein
MPDVVTYQNVLVSLRDVGTVHTLLGNGFSIGCDPVFRYASLYRVAVANGLSARAQEVFGRIGTNNFEGVLRLLDDTLWVGQRYGLSGAGQAQIEEDIRIIKNSLVHSIATTHLENAALVSDLKKAAALGFLNRFKNIFTTNYDLVLYWVILSPAGGPTFGDGFHTPEEEQEAAYLLYTEPTGNRPGIYYLHGALHLYAAEGELRKHSWARTGRHLTDLIREGLTRGEYPLFVAEGLPGQKLTQIARHGYLSHCLNKFSHIQSPLVIYGHALGESDNHLLESLSHNPHLETIYVGLYGDPHSALNEAIAGTANNMIAERRRLIALRGRVSELDVIYYQAESAEVWGAQPA